MYVDCGSSVCKASRGVYSMGCPIYGIHSCRLSYGPSDDFSRPQDDILKGSTLSYGNSSSSE